MPLSNNDFEKISIPNIGLFDFTGFVNMHVNLPRYDLLKRATLAKPTIKF